MSFKSRTSLGPANIYFLKILLAFLIINNIFSFSYPCQWFSIHRMEKRSGPYFVQPTRIPFFPPVTAVSEYGSLFKKFILWGIDWNISVFSSNSDFFHSIISHICSHRQLTPLFSESLQHNYSSSPLSLRWRCSRDKAYDALQTRGINFTIFPASVNLKTQIVMYSLTRFEWLLSILLFIQWKLAYNINERK